MLWNMIEKAYMALNRLLVETWTLMTGSEDSKESEEHYRENINCSRGSLNNHEMTVSFTDIKAFLVKSQKEVRNMLLEPGGKRILVR